MAKLVLGMATSHTPMLNTPPHEWPCFIERDTQRRELLDTDGKHTTYEAQLKRAPADIDAQIAPERMQTRHASVEAAMSRLGDYLRESKLDALIVVGDDQDELYHPDNMPGILVYYGDTIRNMPMAPVANPTWGWRASARDPGTARDPSPTRSRRPGGAHRRRARGSRRSVIHPLRADGG